MIRTRPACLYVLLLALLPGAAPALSLDMPAASQSTFQGAAKYDSYALPVGPYADRRVPVRTVEGHVERQSWRMDGGSDTTLQVFEPLQQQLTGAGYQVVFACDAASCGGFDFRFGIEVIPAPDMHVDIRDYRFLSAQRGDAEYASLLVSRVAGSTFVQLISVSPAQAETRPRPSETAAVIEHVAIPTGPSTGQSLLDNGHVALDDLAFAPGGSALEEREYKSLQELARFLQDHPDGVIVLVGHTDSVGDLASNIRLSKRRAAAVRIRLIGEYDADPKRIEAEGNGYLSPVASNLTPEGRERNRRVEAIYLPR